MNSKNILSVLLVLIGLSTPILAQPIEAGRAVQITIQSVPSEEKGRIDGNYPVSEAGTINMPFIGNVHAAGLRNEDLASAIQSRYRNAGIYTNPTIQVISDIVNKINEQTVVIGGQVRASGPKAYTRGLTLYQAIQAAGGATEFGSMKRVKLFRGGRQTVYDLTKAQFMTVLVAPNDTIEVPAKTPFGG